MINLNPLNVDFSQVPAKLGEMDRWMAIVTGIGAIMLGVAIAAKGKYSKTASFFSIMGFTLIGASIAGIINPVKVGAPPRTSGFNLPSGANFVRAGPVDYWRQRMQYGARNANILPGRIQPTFGTVYGAGEVIIPAGPASNAVKPVRFAAAGEPMYLRYITGVENEGKIVGQ
jgi:hypothetical protein